MTVTRLHFYCKGEYVTVTMSLKASDYVASMTRGDRPCGLFEVVKLGFISVGNSLQVLAS